VDRFIADAETDLATSRPSSSSVMRWFGGNLEAWRLGVEIEREINHAS
jgi:hypothetical protein